MYVWIDYFLLRWRCDGGGDIERTRVADVLDTRFNLVWSFESTTVSFQHDNEVESTSIDWLPLSWLLRSDMRRKLLGERDVVGDDDCISGNSWGRIPSA